MSDVHQEFDRQVTTLLHKGYPEAAGISEAEFIKLLEPLKEKLGDLPKVDVENGYLPFVIVIVSDVVPAEIMMSLVEREGKKGIVKLTPFQPQDFIPTNAAAVPGEKAYLLTEINRGGEFLNITPEKALQEILVKGTIPITIDEGIAIITQYPDFLKKNNCFSLLGSRHEGSQHVPAIWINAKKEPNLGWCWERNPHTWLGSAYAKSKIK